jgi:methylthioribose-1-phosphate isomerase
MMDFTEQVKAVEWVEGKLKLLDQRKLPDQERYHFYETATEVADAIQTMQVRGAPAIGIAAAYAVVLAAKRCYQFDADNWKSLLENDLVLLANSRPTAVNLFWAIEQMRLEIENIEGNPTTPLLDKALQIHKGDLAANRKMGELGAAYIAASEGILTHCNAGALATGGYGTALGVVRSAVDKGLKSVFATETRPWLQGARLTVWELYKDDIHSTLIADSAASSLMRLGSVHWLVVGADRIAANGDVANKVGTYSLAVLAKYHGVKVMVVAPTSTIDWNCKKGEEIPIEERASSELLNPIYGDNVAAWNPSFDVTPAELIELIVTEKGVVERPNQANMQSLMG